MICERLTCVVPTHNRPHFLRRLLHFYMQFPPGFPFLVVDSSNSLLASENREVIESVRGSLDIDYQHIGLNFMDKCVQGLERIRSPFVVFCADDDILLPDTVWRCVEFLTNEPGFASAMGRNAMLNVNHSLWCSRILKGYSIEDDRPFDRCRRMARDWFSNFYAVHRTEGLLNNFRITAANADSQRSPQLSETLLSQMSVLIGRVKLLPMMYSLREQHGTNAGSALRNQREPQAELLYQRFRGCLTDQLERTGIDRADVEQFIDDSYGFFRDPNLANRRRPRSVVEVVRQLYRGMTERTVDYFWTDRTRHRRFVRASDLAECESIWHATIKLVRAFPQGIPSDHSSWKRCA
jgi:glycosyltransferase domain-containing protein